MLDNHPHTLYDTKMTKNKYDNGADKKSELLKRHLIKHNDEYKQAANKETVSKLLTVASGTIILLAEYNPINNPFNEFMMGMISTIFLGCLMVYLSNRDTMNRIFDSTKMPDLTHLNK